MSLFPRTMMGISMFTHATGAVTSTKGSGHTGKNKGLTKKGKAKK